LHELLAIPRFSRRRIDLSNPLLPIPELRFETAAEHHTCNVPLALPDDRVGQVRHLLYAKRFDSVSEIVICDSGRRLVGLVNIEDVLAAADETSMNDIMDRSPPVVTGTTDQEHAAWQAVRHGETSLAVVDTEHRFQGLIPPRRILEVLLWEHDEDTARLGGVLAGGSQALSATNEPISKRLFHRLPWLIVGLIGAALSVDLMGRFEGLLQGNLVLAFFIPGIVYLADAVGTQTETLVIRGMSVGVPVERVFVRELLTGLMIGLVLALICFPFVLIWSGRSDVALAAGVALLATCSVAGAIAMTLPWLLRRLNRDPAFAAGPLATVIQDVLSVLIYLSVCAALVSMN
jgi:magnesium transporter